jgi:hypothetical protein
MSDSGREEGRSDLETVVYVARAGVQAASGWKVAVALGIAFFLLVLFSGFMAAGGSASGGGSLSCSVMGADAKGIPLNYRPWLVKAAAKYHLGPRGVWVVAAIHYVESDFARTPLPGVARGTQNFAGAEGPGQFLATSWEEYGQDGNEDGIKDVYSIPDSVFGTAYYMHKNGAPKDWWDAIFAYNHAGWYVEEVLEKADELEKEGDVTGGGESVCSVIATGPLGDLPSDPVAKIEYVARWIEAKKIHYCWGGGHGPSPGPSEGSGEFCPSGTKGLDCSGSVRWLMVLSGYKDPGGLRSDFLGASFPPGEGKYVTLWASASHIFIEINGRDWGTSSSHQFNGPAFGHQWHWGMFASHPMNL